MIIVAAIKLYPQEFYDRGVPLVTSHVRRIPVQCLDPRIKSLNYLNNIMAKLDAKRANALEAVMLNHQGRVAECTADNIFTYTNGVLMTPDLLEGALGGITRQAVLDIAKKLGIPAVETKMGLHDVYYADECFLTGTGAEIVPVISLDERIIGTGKPGRVTKQLLDEFRKNPRLGIASGVTEQQLSCAVGLHRPSCGSDGCGFWHG